MKFFRIFIINLLIITVILFSIDISIQYKHYQKFLNKKKNDSIAYNINQNEVKRYIPKFEYKWQLVPFEDYWIKELTNKYKIRDVNILNNNKKSILLFGCSFAEGALLKNNESPAYKIAESTNRPVYNRAYSGYGLAPILWQARNPLFYKGIKTDAEYAIAIFIQYQVQRLITDKYSDTVFPQAYIGYNKKQNTLIENKFYFKTLLKFKFIRHILSKLESKNLSNDDLFDLIKLHYIESRKALQEHYPNIKFIIIKHPTNKNKSSFGEWFNKTPRWKELENEGFIIYDLEKELDFDITEKEYLLPDMHPNAKTWEIVIPKLAKDLKL